MAVALSGALPLSADGYLGVAGMTACFIVLAIIVFYLLCVEQRVWRFFTLRDVLELLRASVVVSLLGTAVLLTLARFGVLAVVTPGVIPLQWLLFACLLLATRSFWRFLSGATVPLVELAKQAAPVLVVGSGTECSLFLRSLRSSASPGIEPVGIVADEQIGRSVGNVSVLGGLDDLGRVVGQLEAAGRRPTQLVVTAELREKPMQTLVDTALALDLAVSRLPSPTEMLRSLSHGKLIEPVSLRTLRGWETPPFDSRAAAKGIAGRRLLVTGAGGSIGSELVRLLSGLQPASITLLDHSEFNLYKIDQEIGEKAAGIPRTAWLADVRDRRRLDEVFHATRPEIVFHGAALKHVPMVEANVCEGIRSNVIGSRNVAEAARAIGAVAMVQISTDKAVNPVSVMGASKRLAELFCQSLDIASSQVSGAHATRFITVRFGNVWGSCGSVVPLFVRQIEHGGPVTVTHPEIERFFMTIREACELVVSAAVSGLGAGAEPGLVYVLDMGEPLRIADLARQLVRLHGKRPDEDIKIEFVGLRPGEKLYEELFDRNEERVAGPSKGLKPIITKNGTCRTIIRKRWPESDPKSSLETAPDPIHKVGTKTAARVIWHQIDWDITCRIRRWSSLSKKKRQTDLS